MDDATDSNRALYSEMILPELLRRELGVVDYVDDRGGKTAHGITERVAKRLGIDIDTIDHQTAMDIYRVEYYEKPGFHKIHQDIRLQWRLTLDGLHSGTRTVIKRLQVLINLNRLKTGQRIEVDGVFGPITDKALVITINELWSEYSNRGHSKPMNAAIWDICSQLKALQYGLYHDICRNDETQMKWWWGWCNRIRFEPEFYREMPSIYK